MHRPCGVESNAQPAVQRGAPEVAAEGERGPLRVHLREECVLAAVVARVEPPRGREIDGGRVPRHVRRSRGIHGDGESLVAVRSSEEPAVDDRSSRRVHLRDERIQFAAQARIETADRREVDGCGIPGHVGRPRTIHGDPSAAVEEPAPQESAVRKGAPGGVDLRDEGVVVPDVGGAEASHRREVGRTCGTRDVHRPGGVDAEALPLFIFGSSEESAPSEGAPLGIDLRHEGVVVAPVERGAERPCRGEVGRVGQPRHVRGPGGVRGDAEAVLAVRSPEVGAVDERRPVGVHLRDERVAGAAVRRIEASRDREVGGRRDARHVGRTRGVHGDGVARVPVRSSEIRSVHERGALGVHLDHEGIVAPVVGGIESPCRREIPGVRLARQVRGTRAVDGDAMAPVRPGSPEECAGDDRLGIKDKGKGRIECAEVEAEALSIQGVRSGHREARAFPLLVGDGSGVFERTERGLEDEAAVRAEPRGGRAAHRDPDAPRVRARCDHELVLETVRLAAVDEIHPGPEVVVDDAGVGRTAGLPLLGVVSPEVADDRLLHLLAANDDVRVRPQEIELERPAPVDAVEGDRDAVRGEVEGPPRSRHMESHRLVETALVLDEKIRQARSEPVVCARVSCDGGERIRGHRLRPRDRQDPGRTARENEQRSHPDPLDAHRSVRRRPPTPGSPRGEETVGGRREHIPCQAGCVTGPRRVRRPEPMSAADRSRPGAGNLDGLEGPAAPASGESLSPGIPRRSMRGVTDR